MFRKLLCSLFVMGVCIGLATAEEFTAILKKVDGDKVTFAKFNFKDKDKKPEDTTLPVAKDAKIAKGKTSFADKKFKVEVGETIEGGLKSETFAKISEKGLFVRITTSEDNKTITQILVTQFKKKDEKKTDK